ncbi:MAG TPA: TonB family protein [Polyangia bacterium]|nr:TonB family protein [Polyangia bacterium]
MRLASVCVSLGILLCGCRLEAPPPAPAPAPGSSAGQEKRAEERDDIPGGRFFCRTDRGAVRQLDLRKLVLGVTTGPGTVRSQLVMEVAGPAGERVEAVMRLPVPRGAAVTAARLWVNGQAMSGAFVERDRARGIYRSIVERRRDPALVTWDGPGWVSVSIFPLERGETRRFELDWIEPAGLKDGVVQVRVPTIIEAGHVVGRPSLVVDGRPLATGGRELVALPGAATGADRVEHIVADRAPGDPFHRLLVRPSQSAGPVDLVLVAETSVGMTARDRRHQRDAIAAVLAALPATAKVTLLAADWDVSVVAEAVDPAGARQALERLDDVVSAGALHLERALSAAAARAGARGATSVLFVGRGVDSFHGDALDGPLADLRRGGIRLSVVATGEIPRPLADAAALTGGEVLGAEALGGDLASLVAALQARPSPPTLAARGVDWHPLETATGETVWMGRALEIPRAPGSDRPDAAIAEAIDLVPLWDRARLAWSEHADRAERTATTALTPLRALLVLETEYDYKRFGLFAREEQRDGSASGARDTAVGNDAADVLGGLVGNQIGQAYGVGGLGLVGTGSGGGASEGTIGLGNLGTIGKSAGGGNGSGYGRGAGGLGGRRARVPDVVPGQPEVRGPLDKEIIRRIIRRHVNEVKYCYEQELAQRPDLGGRIMVQFTIAASGQVIASMLQNSTMGNARVENCTVQAVRRWEFPKPIGGGIAIVSYPFVLTPGSGPVYVPPPPPPPAPPAPPPAQAVDPDLRTWQALTVLAGTGELTTRVERVAALLGLDRTSDAESLAWTIDRRNLSGREILLVARLLAAAHRNHDAIRVLSEQASSMPTATAQELRRMGDGASAAEVLALTRRAP